MKTLVFNQCSKTSHEVDFYFPTKIFNLFIADIVTLVVESLFYVYYKNTNNYKH